jgi:DNA-directed RNA polymerase subunit beta
MNFPQKIFSKAQKPSAPPPDLISIQLESFEWFKREGLRELFQEVSPVLDYTGKELALWINDYYFDEPKIDEQFAKERNMSYEAALRGKFKLQNKRTGEIKEQEIFLGDFPIMTKRGTFVVNGVERVVVSQLIRSAGIFFTAENFRGRRLFGAKIIPNRGAWLEFETDSAGVISVRIDRKRKVPATVVLKAFGLVENEDIKKKFKDVDTNKDTDKDTNHIEATLKQDSVKTRDEAYLEIYKRIRPGELAAVDNAKSLVESMFFGFDRYDLSRVGRYKISMRLYGLSSAEAKKRKISIEDRLLNVDDIVGVLKEIIRLNNTSDAKPDDIDHLGNRRVRTIGELLQNKLRVGLLRTARIVKDRMSTLDINTVTPAQLINSRPFMAAVKEFFTSSQLAQFMDQVNPLAELEHKRRLSAMGPGGLTRERAGFEVRDVHASHYGRICPIQTPEGPNIGLVGHLATYARINEFGFIETPYQVVKNGKISNEFIYLTASEEEKFNIAHAGIRLDESGIILDDLVEARIKGSPGMARKEDIQLIDVAPQQFISVATSLIPFLEHDDANRALMGSNMQRQAVSCINPEAPLVSTGAESQSARDSGQVVVAEEDGVVIEVDAKHITVLPDKKTGSARQQNKIYPLHAFTRSNQSTNISNQPLIKKGQKVKKGDILADGSSTDNGQLALGQNLLVAFLSFSGANFEDAIIISERLVKDERFSSIHIESFTSDVRDTKLGPEQLTPDIPNVSEEKLKNLDEEGIIRIGAEVRERDILVGKISPKGEADLTPEERLLRAIFGEKAADVKDTSKLLDHGKRGRVVAVQIFSRDRGDKLEAGIIRRVQVDVAQLRKVSVGDKLAGRHGNKGVISKILPEEDMPHLADGTPVDIILNPLGVASRMNIGQILETHLGWAADKLNYQAICPALAGPMEDKIKSELKKAGLPESGQVRLFDGRSGEPFVRPVTIGYIYMMKLNHLVEDKIHMRAIGPYSLITQQPLGGKAQFGGQRFGEMEVWALEGYGAAHTLQEMLTIKSDDVLGRNAAYDSIIRGEKLKNPHLPASFHVLVNELKSLGLLVDLLGEGGNVIAEDQIKKEEEKEVSPETKAEISIQTRQF